MSVSSVCKFFNTIVVCIILLMTSPALGFDLYFDNLPDGPVPTGGSDHTFKDIPSGTRNYTARLLCRLGSGESLPSTVNLIVTLLRDGSYVSSETKSFSASNWVQSSSDPSLYYINLLVYHYPYYFFTYYVFNMPEPGPGQNQLRTDDYQFKLTMKALGESDTSDNTAYSDPFHYSVYSRNLNFNGETKTVDSLLTGSSAFCPGDTYITSIAGNWDQSWWDANFAGSDLCAQSSPNPDGYSTDLDVVMDLSIASPASVSGTRYGIKGQALSPLTLNTVRVECSGTRPATFTFSNTLLRSGTPDITVRDYLDILMTPTWSEDTTNNVYYYEFSPAFYLPEPGPRDTNMQSGSHKFAYSAGAAMDTDPSNNSAESSFYYTVYSGRLFFNDVVADINSVAFDYDPLCSLYPFPKPSTDVSGYWSDVFGTVPLSATGLCTSSADNPDGYSKDLHVTSGTADLGTVTGTVGGMEIDFESVILSQNGGNFTSAVLHLPEDVTVHEYDGHVVPRGSSELVFDGASFTESMTSVELSLSDTMFFHQYGLPFYLYTSYVSMPLQASTSLSLAYPRPYYIHYESYAELDQYDSRINTGLPSNDIVFSTPASPGSNVIEMGDGGFSGKLYFQRTTQSLPTSFPLGRVNYGDWVLYLNNGRIMPSSVLSEVTFETQFKRDCPDGSCGNSGARYGRYQVQANKAGIFENGAFGARFERLGANLLDGTNSVEWGYFPDKNGTFIRRDSDAPGVFMVAGFIMPGTSEPEGSTIGQDLLGSWTFEDESTPSRFAALNDPRDSQATVGDGYFAGLNMGPEYYSDSIDEGVGSLLGSSLYVRFYKPDPAHPGPHIEMPDDPRGAVKYVLRQGGLTGVFNTAFTSEHSGTVEIYNYDISFDRFAFRQDRNRPDGTTFIDGSLTLTSGPVAVNSEGQEQDFLVAFTDLDITCNGNLGAGQVDTEPEPTWPVCQGDNDNDGVEDEGCRTLMYWDMPVLLSAMAFKNDPDTDPDSGDCPSEPRKLGLDTLNQVDGFGQSLNMSALYPPDGTVENQELVGEVQSWFDKPAQGDKPGFNIRLRKAYINQVTGSIPSIPGFTVLAGLTDVPLFDDAPLSAHFDNGDPEDHDEYQLYVFKDETDSDGDFDGVPDTYALEPDQFRQLLENDDKQAPKPYFTYYWPSPGMVDLNYYGRYNRSSGEEMPWFKGLKKESDILNIIDVSSVPDYINPEKTKFSFGISADVSELQNFQVDVNDLASGVDSFLHNALGVDASFSLEDILCYTPPGGEKICLDDTEELMHGLTGGDLSDLLGGAIDTVLSSGPLSNVIHEAAQGLNVAHQAGSQIQSVLFEPLKQAEQLVLEHANVPGFQGDLKYLYNNWAAVMVYRVDDLEGLSGAPTIDELRQMREHVQALRQQVAALSNAMQQGLDVFQQATGVLTAADGLISRARQATQDAKNVMGELDSAMNSQLAGLLDTDPENNPMLGRIEQARHVVHQVRDAIAAVDLGRFADVLQSAALAAGSSIDTSMIESAQQTVTSSLNELDQALDNADDAITQLYASLPLSDMLNQARSLVQPGGPVITTLDMLDSALLNIQSRLNSLQTLVSGELSVLQGQFAALETMMGQELAVPSTLSSWNAAMENGRQALDNFASQFVNSAVAGGALGAELNLLAGTYTTGSSWFMHVFAMDASLVPNLVEAAFRDILEDVGAGGLQAWMEQVGLATTACLPQPSEDDIRNMIKTALLDSGAVGELNSVFYRQFGMLSDVIDNISTQLTARINGLIRDAVASVNEGISNTLGSAVNSIAGSSWSDGGADSPLKSVGIDGYAIVSQDEFERLHMEAEFVLSGEPDDTSYNAALDVTSWRADNGKTGCLDGDGNYYDVTISTHDVTADMLGLDIGIKTAMLGFTIDPSVIPIGLFGNFYLDGELNFETLVLEDLGLEFGVGKLEAYFGATGAGRFEQYRIPKAAFFFGKSCDFAVLERLDSEAAEFIGTISPLIGVYVRGSVQVPIYNGGCFFTIGVGADIGAWYFTNPPPGTYGGLVGGSAYGQLACLASLKGKVRCLGQKSGSEYKFHGDGWAAAGIGSCSPGSWDSVSDARNDDWCLTGDATFGAEYNHGWEIDGPNVNCCD